MSQASLLLSALRRRWLPAFAVFFAALGTSIVYLVTVEPEYVATARLIVDERSVSLSELGQELTESRADPPGDANPLATESELVQSQKVIKQAISLLADQDVPTDNLAPREIAEELTVKIIPATNILEVSYRSSQPELAADILNAVLQSMASESAKAIRLEATTVRNFLEAEVPRLQSRLAEIETTESQYRQQSGLISPEKQAESLIESLSALEEEESQLMAQIQGAITRDSQLQQITDVSDLPQAYAAVRVGQNAELTELRQQLLALETQVIDSQSRLGDQHPDLLALLEQRDATRNLYTQQLQAASSADISSDNIAAEDLSQELLSQQINGEVERSALESRLEVIQAERSRLESLLTQFPSQQKPLATLIRQKEEATTSLTLLQDKLEEARIAEAQLISNIRIIGEAEVPSASSWPKTEAVLVLAIASGLVLAIAVVILLELLDDFIHSAAEAVALTQLPILGVLPKLPEAALSLHQPEHFLDDPALIEPYRMLLQTLEFQAHNQCRIIIVSSTLADEGKSIVTSHLAAASALLARRTLVIDIDLRRPTQADLFRQPPVPGITTVLEGKHTLLEAAQATNLENLWLLPHGDLSKRPSVLIERLVQEGLLVEAAKHFDCVVIDTPPVNSCADAMILGRQGDGMFLVFRPGFTPKSALQRVTAELKNSGVPLLGMVENGGRTRTELYYQALSAQENLKSLPELSTSHSGDRTEYSSKSDQPR